MNPSASRNARPLQLLSCLALCALSACAVQQAPEPLYDYGLGLDRSVPAPLMDFGMALFDAAPGLDAAPRLASR